jgi:asparaginyl-tRNA synthetase
MSSPITTVAEIGKHEGQSVTIRGWLYNLREAGSCCSDLS